MDTIQLTGDYLKSIGFQYVTGEACALSMRQLYEVSPEVMKTYLEYTGIQVSFDSIPKSTYNNRENYAVFLTPTIVQDLAIMMLVKKWNCVCKIHPYIEGKIIGGDRPVAYLIVGERQEIRDFMAEHPALYSQVSLNEETWAVEKTEAMYDVGRFYSIYKEQPHRGFSNVSAFTGTSH